MICLCCGADLGNVRKKFCNKSCAMKYRWKDPIYRGNVSKKSSDMWRNPEYLEKLNIVHTSEEYRNKRSIIARNSMSNKETKNKCLNALIDYFKESSNHEKHSITQKMLWDDAKRNRQSALMTELWKDPEFASKCFNSGKTYAEYKFDDERTIKVQGYEPFALDYLGKIYVDDDIIAGIQDIANQFKFSYEHGGKVHRYWPDIFIKSTNTIIEVKSQFHYENELEKNMAKRNTVLAAGYNFMFMIMDGRTRNVTFI